MGLRLWVCKVSNSTTTHFQSSWRKTTTPSSITSTLNSTVLTFNFAGLCSGGLQWSYHIHCLATLTTRDHNTLSGVRAACGADRSRRPPRLQRQLLRQPNASVFLPRQPTSHHQRSGLPPSLRFYPSPTATHTHAKLSRTTMAPHQPPLLQLKTQNRH